MTELDDVLAKLSPATRKKVQLAQELVEEKQELPSIGLTKVLQGGLKYGAQHMFWGSRSGGKTMLGLQTIGLAQKKGKVCLLVDAEDSYTKEWGERLGVDNSKLLILKNEKTFSGVTNKVVEYIRAGVDFVLIDSISTLVPGSFFEKENKELKNFEDTNQIGQHAKECGKMCATLNLVNESTLILLISQVTTGIYRWGAIPEPQGGNKTGHINSVTLKLTSSLIEKNQIKGNVLDGNIVLEQAIGRTVDWFVDKERGPGMGSKGEYDIYFAGDFCGIDNIAEIVDYGVKYGLIEQRGPWFYIDEDKYQGKANLVKALKDNDELVQLLRKKIVS